MATLYEINNQIMDCIDLETGEIVHEDKLAALKLDKHEKLRNIAFLAINMTADAAALKEQETKFAARRKRAESTAKWAKETLAKELAGQTMKEPEFTISYKKSETVEVADSFVDKLPPEFLTPVAPKVNKVELKKALKQGAIIEGVSLVEHSNIQVK